MNMYLQLKSIIFISNIITVILLTSCVGGNSSSDNIGSTGLARINGHLLLKQYNSYPTISFSLKNGVISNQTTAFIGKEAKAHPNGRIVFVQQKGCPQTEVRLSIKETTGQITPVTTCSRNLNGFSGDNYDFYTPKISPDNTKVAVALTHSFYFTNLSVAVFNMKGKLLALHKDYAFPAWHPDGYLLMAGPEKNTGIYKTDASLQNVTRIDDGSLSNIISNIDINPNGDKVAFAYKNAVWIMGTNEANPRKLFSAGSMQKHGVTWSPDGRYIAYFIADTNGLLTNSLEHKIYFYELSSQKTWSISTDEVFIDTPVNPYSPLTPLSWIK